MLPRSLRSRVALVAALLAVASGVLLAAMQALLSNRAAESMRAAEQQALAERAAAEVQDKLAINLSVLQAFARLVPADRIGDEAAMRAFLDAHRTLGDVFHPMAVVHPSGRIIAYLPAGGGPSGAFSLADRDHFRKTIVTGQPQVSQPIKGRVNGRHLIVLTMPLRNAAGRLVGVLTGGLDLAQPNLFASLVDQRLGRGGLLTLVAGDGTVISHPDAHLVGQRMTDLPASREVYARGLIGNHEGVLPGMSARNVPSYFAFAQVPGSSWRVVTEVPRDEVDRPLRMVLLRALAIGALAAVAVGVIFWMALLRLLAPLARLRLGLEQLRDQSPDQPARLAFEGASDEIAALADQFNRLSEARTRAHRDLSTERDRMHATLHAVTDAVISVDAAGCIDMINDEAARLMGVADDQVLGRRLPDVFALLDGTPHGGRAWLQAAMGRDGSVPLPHDAMLQAASGRRLSVEGKVAPLVRGGRARAGAVLSFRDVTQAREQVQEMAWRAAHDPLTELLNRAGFGTALHGAMDAAAAGRRHALMVMDLDGFKAVNDRGGHAAGDKVLVRIAQLLREVLREGDDIARLGGDEFAMLLVDCTPQQARQTAQKLCDAIAGLQVQYDGRPYVVSASIGVVPVDGTQADRAILMRMADLACYAAKEAGKNRCAVADVDQDPGRLWPARPPHAEPAIAA